MTNKKTNRKRFWTYILLHWSVLVIVIISFVSGLSISFSDPQANITPEWMRAIALQGNVFFWHLSSAAFLCFVSLYYLGFLLFRQDTRRLNAIRAIKIFLTSSDKSHRRWNLTILVYWLLYSVLTILMVSGISLYFFSRGLIPFPERLLANIHEYSAWIIAIGILLHIVVQWLASGFSGLLVMCHPKFGANKQSLAAMLIAAVCLSTFLILDANMEQNLPVNWADSPPLIDGDPNDEQWQSSSPITIHTIRGANGEQGYIPVTLKALYDNKSFYILASWPDKTPSIEHLPLIKTDEGWKVLQTNFINSDETQYYEDKFALMLSSGNQLVGDATVHLGAKPLENKPGPRHKRGLHYTLPHTQSIVDVWHWKSVRTGTMRRADDEYFGPPLDERLCERRYPGGYYPDPTGDKTYKMNWLWFKEGIITPKRLPKIVGQLEMPRPDVPGTPKTWPGKSVLHWDDTKPYSVDADQYPVGTRLPSILLLGKSNGDRGDVNAQAHWREGRWYLEMSRRLETYSQYDLSINNDIYLWVAVFDHAQTQHTTHLQGIKVQLSKGPIKNSEKYNNSEKHDVASNTNFTDKTINKPWKFQKIDHNGKPLHPLDGPWACVHDESTGLMWEVKSDNEGPRFHNWSYSWFLNGEGASQNSTCNYDTIDCNTQTLITQLNEIKLCGRSNWRLPTADELSSLVYPSSRPAELHIPACYFPHTNHGYYWSSDNKRNGTKLEATVVDFFNGEKLIRSVNDPAYARLVSGE